MSEILHVPRFRRKSTVRTKMGIAHAGTLLSNIGAGSVPTEFEVLETEAGTRSLTGAAQTITDSRTTGEVVNIGDVVKYINLFIQIASRSDADLARQGWLEWAFVCVKESETSLPITNIGLDTLGVCANRMYRNECIYTGNIPVGLAVPNSLDIKIKIPKSKQTIRFGDEWRFYCYYRSNDSADVSTVDMRLVQSFMYKAYK